MFEVWANGESFSRAESPGFAIVGLSVDENHVAKGANWSGIAIEFYIEVLPGRELRNNIGLSKEV